jgi:hypothetical protein
MPSEEIPLWDSPERFFDSATWREFLSFFKSRDEALLHISHPEPKILVFYRQQVAKLSTPERELARRDEHIAELGGKLVGQFKDRLIREEIIATGFSPLAVERVRIPGERWVELWPNFSENRADGKHLNFNYVKVIEAAERPTSAADLLDRCVAWMQSRGHDGESRRKVLQTEALEHFGPALTTRTFAVAYKSVFGKSRGRPRKAEPK